MKASIVFEDCDEGVQFRLETDPPLINTEQTVSIKPPRVNVESTKTGDSGLWNSMRVEIGIICVVEEDNEITVLPS